MNIVALNPEKRAQRMEIELFNLKENLRVAIELLVDILKAIDNGDDEELIEIKDDAEVFLDDYKDEQKRR